MAAPPAIDIVRKQFTITVPKRKDPLTLTYTVVTDPANLGKDSDDEFYVIDLDGSHLRRLTYDSWDSGVSGDACLPVFIPKSDYFIYSHNGELVQRTAKDPTLFPLPATVGCPDRRVLHSHRGFRGREDVPLHPTHV